MPWIGLPISNNEIIINFDCFDENMVMILVLAMLKSYLEYKQFDKFMLFHIIFDH